MNWVYGEQIEISEQSCSHLFPLYLSLGWRGGAGGEVSEIRNFKNFYLLYSLKLLLHSGTLYQVKSKTLQNNEVQRPSQ